MNVLSKIFAILLLVTTLFLQGCATGGHGRPVAVENCVPQRTVLMGRDGRPEMNEVSDRECAERNARNTEVSLYWDSFSKEYREIRGRGGRVDLQGRLLTPVPGKPGQFQDRDGYRVIHQLTCNKENGLVAFFGDLVAIGATQMTNGIVRVATPALVGAARQSASRSRQYSCAEIAEELNAGNVVFKGRVDNGDLLSNRSSSQVQDTDNSPSFLTEEGVQPFEPLRTQTQSLESNSSSVSQVNQDRCDAAKKNSPERALKNCSTGTRWQPAGHNEQGQIVCACA